ncbi:MAG: hypothetical protein WCF92_02310 [bacterium]
MEKDIAKAYETEHTAIYESMQHFLEDDAVSSVYKRDPAQIQAYIEEDKVIGETFDFEDPFNKKTTPVCLKKINQVLGWGEQARWVADVDVEVISEDLSNIKTRKMVVKKFNNENTNGDKNLVDSYFIFQLLKKFKFPTWDTYRINREHLMALMTSKATENEIILTGLDTIINGQRIIEFFKNNPIKQISNLDDFVENAKVMINRMDSEDVQFRIWPHQYGVAYKPVASTPGFYEANLLIADLDRLDISIEEPFKQEPKDEIRKTWKADNLKNLRTALKLDFPGTPEERELFVELVMSKIK